MKFLKNGVVRISFLVNVGAPILICLILWFTVKWRPKLLFSFERVKSLFSFGWKLLCSALLDTVFRNIYNLIIGKIYNSQSLGYFSRDVNEAIFLGSLALKICLETME